MKPAIYFHQDRCVGCHSCVVACKLEQNLPPHPVSPSTGNPEGPNLIRVHRVGPQISDGEVTQHFQPITCMHCVDAPCIPACPQSAIYQDGGTGITLVRANECEGCRLCLGACPYGAPQFWDDKMILCNLCIHRLAEGRRTACETACPARAIHVGTSAETSAMMTEQ